MLNHNDPKLIKNNTYLICIEILTGNVIWADFVLIINYINTTLNVFFITAIEVLSPTDGLHFMSRRLFCSAFVFGWRRVDSWVPLFPSNVYWIGSQEQCTELSTVKYSSVLLVKQEDITKILCCLIYLILIYFIGSTHWKASKVTHINYEVIILAVQYMRMKIFYRSKLTNFKMNELLVYNLWIVSDVLISTREGVVVQFI